MNLANFGINFFLFHLKSALFRMWTELMPNSTHFHPFFLATARAPGTLWTVLASEEQHLICGRAGTPSHLRGPTSSPSPAASAVCPLPPGRPPGSTSVTGSI